ncbi:hypothetical protein [Salinigranum marinum]|uniref:hypothetical protein n=1 Tax=Salinigranum marinum TaxID=1515595 RepID=UPI002989B315|nr:hypothetical protein [Salinigranum marinum]
MQADLTAFHVENQPFEGFVFTDVSLVEFIDQAVDRGIDEFYVFEDRTAEGGVDFGGVCYIHGERAHTRYVESDERLGPQQEQSESRGSVGMLGGFGRDESEEEVQRKKEVATELLNQYADYLEESERFDLENRVESMRLRQLERMQERIEKEARTDPEEEKRLARIAYEDDRFHRQFNQTDTEMLLEELDVEYDPDLVRMDEVHKRAKSLLKINK